MLPLEGVVEGVLEGVVEGVAEGVAGGGVECERHEVEWCSGAAQLFTFCSQIVKTLRQFTRAESNYNDMLNLNSIYSQNNKKEF